MKLYYVSWTLLVLVSLWISVAGFFWALHHGQFNEQGRARYLPLRGEQGPALPDMGKKGIREVCVMLGILFLGAAALVATAATVVFTVIGGKP
jgi:hypothetical protein